MSTEPSTRNDSAEVHEYRRQLRRLIEERRTVLAVIEVEQRELADALAMVADVTKARDYLRKIAEKLQQRTHKQIARIVSRCLSAVFEEPYELRIAFVERRGKTEAEFLFFRDGNAVRPKLTSGGVRHVTAVALRLGSLLLTMPPRRKLLILDEPFMGLAGESLARMGRLIETLARELEAQFLIVTHNEALKIGKVVELTRLSS